MAENVLLENDLSALLGVVAGLEGYLRLGVGDPTGRAHALKHVVRRFTADLTQDATQDLTRGLTRDLTGDLTGDRRPAEPDDDLARRAHELGDRLRSQLATLRQGSD